MRAGEATQGHEQDGTEGLAGRAEDQERDRTRDLERRAVGGMRGRMRALGVIAAALPALAVGCSSLPPVHGEERGVVTSGMTAIFDRYRASIPLSMRDHRIPGLAVAVASREGTLWAAGFGFADGGRRVPVTPETIFSIQSISKAFTAAAVMIAAQEGLVDLDAPITAYLPDFTVQSRYQAQPEAAITLRRLLDCTAGFGHEAPVGNNYDARSPSFDEHVRSISETWLRHRVGERWSYSNLGFDLAAAVLEKASGRPFGEFLKDRLLDPLGMNESSADMAVIRASASRAVGHSRYFSTMPVEVPMVGAGGVYASARDMARFVQFHLNGGMIDGRRVLERRLLDQLYAPVAPSWNYGLGMAVGRDHQSWFANHNGGGFGFLASMTFYPEYGIGTVVLTNSADHGDQQVKLATSILDSLIGTGVVARGGAGEPPTAGDPLTAEEVFRRAADGPPGDASQGSGPQGDASQAESASKGSGTPYHKEWARYTGTYRYLTAGFLPTFPVRVAWALRLSTPDTFAVSERDGSLSVAGERLEEYLPGLFFTASGGTLDFRADPPRRDNCALVKIR